MATMRTDRRGGRGKSGADEAVSGALGISRHEQRRREFREAQKAREALKKFESSRLCVKNVPKYADAKRIKEFFSNGKLSPPVTVTDVRVLKTPAGQSRQLAFVGFTDEKEAARVLTYYNKSFFDTCKLGISFALPFGDERLKTAVDGGSKKRKRVVDDTTDGAVAATDQNDTDDKAGAGKKRLSEFLSLMQPRNQSQFWANDDGKTEGDTIEESESDSESSSGSEEDDEIFDSTKPKMSGDTNQMQKQKQEEEDRNKRKKHACKEPSVDLAAESGRLFVRNLSYATVESDLESLFQKFGPVSEVHIPVDDAGRSRGFGYVLFMIPEHAVKAMGAMDMQIFQGRLLHIMSALEKPTAEVTEGSSDGKAANGSFKAKKEAERREKAGDSRNWNALFVRGDAAVGAVADQLNVKKSDLLLGEVGGSDNESDDDQGKKMPSAAVRMALSETRVIAETKQFLADEGVDVARFEQGIRDPSSVQRSKNCLLVKNLPANTDKVQLRQMFAAFGDVAKFVVPSSKTIALVTFYDAKNAKKAFRGLAYKRYKQVPIYLEWAPDQVLETTATPDSNRSSERKEDAGQHEKEQQEHESVQTKATHHTLFVKNLNFNTAESALKAFFQDLVGKKLREKVLHASVPRKNGLALGFGFVEFADQTACTTALRSARGKELDGHALQVTVSEGSQRTNGALLSAEQHQKRKQQLDKRKNQPDTDLESAQAAKLKSTKIVVRNLAFEANRKELKQLMATYGQVNTIRIPKKFDGAHRGFAFVDFVTHQEAKAAFKALTNTHLYGRHLVIEWATNSED